MITDDSPYDDWDRLYDEPDHETDDPQPRHHGEGRMRCVTCDWWDGVATARSVIQGHASMPCVTANGRAFVVPIPAGDRPAGHRLRAQKRRVPDA